MSKPGISTLSLLGVFFVLLVSLTGMLYSQTQANCSFTYFNPPATFIYGFYPNGINHYNTVVGGVFGPSQNIEKAFIRFSGGTMNLFGVPNATWTVLSKRNIHGTSVGAYGSGTSSLPPGSGANGLILTAGSYTTLNYPVSPSTALSGINKYNTPHSIQKRKARLDSNTRTEFSARSYIPVQCKPSPPQSATMA